MKILHIIGSMDPATGGPCQGIRNLNRSFLERGIHREVASLDDPRSAFLGSDAFAIHALGPHKSPWQYSPKLLPWLIENLARFDVAIVNGIWLYHVYAVIKAIKILKSRKITFYNDSNKSPKVFLMPHGMLDPYFQKAASRRLKAFRNWIYWNLIEHKNIQEANGLLFTCERELRLAQESFKSYKPKKQINVGYGVEEAPSFNQKMKLAFREKCDGLNELPYFLFLGRIHPKKGVDMLVVAYIKLFKLYKMQKRNYELPKLVLAGPGIGTAFGKSLQKLILKFPEIQSSILFTGMLSGDSKWGAIYGCEAFILSSHQENFGIAVVEALACRKPVLISNQINIWKEIVASGGGIVKDDTLDGTIELLKCWINLSQEEKFKMAQNARDCYDEHFAILPASLKFLKAIENN